MSTLNRLMIVTATALALIVPSTGFAYDSTGDVEGIPDLLSIFYAKDTRVEKTEKKDAKKSVERDDEREQADSSREGSSDESR